MSPRLDEMLKTATAALADAGLADPRREASSLVGWALGRDRAFLIAHPEYEPTELEADRFADALRRRAAREPLQYITGVQEFFGLDFEVTPDVLIPRPETEIIVEQALAFVDRLDEPRICEIGAGSGCISVAILSKRRDATSVAADISPKALAVARRNAEKHDVESRIRFVESDVFDAISDEKFDVVVSNPPYVPVADIAGLQPEVRDHEPSNALTDGGDGLSIVRKVVEGAESRLDEGGLLLIEIGIDQSQSVRNIAEAGRWTDVTFVKDLQGIERTLRCRKRI